ncbi:RnfH family protein [Methylophilus aquaticus]|uniref:UPF0125 protein Q9291_11120 n=1 Tax=Methylophilus aquaticus TaxID=1971610 RepID=A0ABT9JV22_9PROT|nr:RnfH family protein [Methylophilus aquaticus]MDP8568399.1 RnfH family protein [Methylophilus aquaticus]
MPEKHPDNIMVEVAYALPQQQLILPLYVKTGTTALEAIRQSGIVQKFPEINLDHIEIGVFGKVVKSDTPLRPLDRVEIYRPLIADAKEVRRQRAAEGKDLK